MTEEQKKMLTEFIEECWHEPLPEFDSYVTSGLRWRCPKCNYVQTLRFRGTDHTFLTPDDQQACMEALVREGKWDDFLCFSWGNTPESSEEIAKHFATLLKPPIFCELVADFLLTKLPLGDTL